MMNNMGQCCVAGKRFIVVEELAERFLSKFKTALEAFKPGDPMDKATTFANDSSPFGTVQGNMSGSALWFQNAFFALADPNAPVYPPVGPVLY